MSARVPGVLALAFIAVLVGGATVGLGLEAWRGWSGTTDVFDVGMLRIARFTLWQALLSTLLSIAPAIFVARALSRHPAFPGRRLLLWLFAVPLGLPAIVAALGLLALYGRAGLVADALSWSGHDWPGIYGLPGILVAHVFFNLPLATRLLLEQLEIVPADHWRVASQLGMGPAATFRLIEWPAIRKALPGTAALVFMLCVTSFTLVLTLGGGPAATTLEVAIYQALRFDFEPARAAALVVVQLAITVGAVVVMRRLGADSAGDASLPVAGRRVADALPIESLANGAIIAIAATFVVGPIAAVVVAGLAADVPRLLAEPVVLRAAATSLILASLSATLAAGMALALASLRRGLETARGRSGPSLPERIADSWPTFILVIPPLVLGAGWFMAMRSVADVFALAPVMIVAVNAAMAMPFALRVLRPAWDANALRHDRLSAQLGLVGSTRWRIVDWPVLRRPIATALAFAMALSLGDLGVVALFGSDAVQTLPYLLYARMGSYRTADAAGLALLLGLACFALMALADRLGRARP